MTTNEHMPDRRPPTRAVSDSELGVAAVLVGIVIVLATIVVPLIG
jgi:hypothetical protein